MEVKVITSRYAERPKTDPTARVFRIADYIVRKGATRAGRMYVGDEFRAVVITLPPGDAQEPHMHPATSHAWFVVSGKGELTMEDGRRETLEPGLFSVHPHNTVHGLRNIGDEDLVYIALSIGA